MTKNIKFPFDIPGYHVTIRPTNGISENFEKILVGKFQEYEYIILTFESMGDSRHCHIIVAYKSSATNLRTMVKRMLDSAKVPYGRAGVKINRITRTIHNSVAYLFKENSPSVCKGFEQTWIDECIRLKSLQVVSKHTTVPSHLVGEYVEDYASRHQMVIESYKDVCEVMLEMAKDKFIFTNMRKSTMILKQYFASKDPQYYRDVLFSEFNLM